jgi:hypothetical protein
VSHSKEPTYLVCRGICSPLEFTGTSQCRQSDGKHAGNVVQDEDGMDDNDDDVERVSDDKEAEEYEEVHAEGVHGGGEESEKSGSTG